MKKLILFALCASLSLGMSAAKKTTKKKAKKAENAAEEK